MSDPFRRRGRNGPVLSREEGNRQGRVVRSAQAALGSVDAVRAFLNTHHASLDARPLDLAVASEAGLTAVEALVSAEGLAARSSPQEEKR
ncbi:MAG TPA: antitoxin Xre/MbcA/ParS toxin-binding domain-containing protein [Allosphingosinicella sp.]|nr:antitoxin Xre/MbcA/ParS toxin-binding domain-containing protein [Allosphingosinicella sp.]